MRKNYVEILGADRKNSTGNKYKKKERTKKERERKRKEKRETEKKKLQNRWIRRALKAA